MRRVENLSFLLFCGGLSLPEKGSWRRLRTDVEQCVHGLLEKGWGESECMTFCSPPQQAEIHSRACRLNHFLQEYREFNKPAGKRTT